MRIKTILNRSNSCYNKIIHTKYCYKLFVVLRKGDHHERGFQRSRITSFKKGQTGYFPDDFQSFRINPCFACRTGSVSLQYISLV